MLYSVVNRTEIAERDQACRSSCPRKQLLACFFLPSTGEAEGGARVFFQVTKLAPADIHFFLPFLLFSACCAEAVDRRLDDVAGRVDLKIRKLDVACITASATHKQRLLDARAHAVLCNARNFVRLEKGQSERENKLHPGHPLLQDTGDL